MLALLVYCHANGVFSPRRIERATYRDIGARFIAANTHPDRGYCLGLNFDPSLRSARARE